MQLDQVDGRLRANALEHFLLIVDEDQRAVFGGPDTESVCRSHKVSLLCDPFTDVARAHPFARAWCRT